MRRVVIKRKGTAGSLTLLILAVDVHCYHTVVVSIAHAFCTE